MIHHTCHAYMTIYVPLDPDLRMACVTFDPAKPHTHPMGPTTKITLDIKEKYRKCVRAAGVLGTTVQKVDDGKQYFHMHTFTHKLNLFLNLSPDHSPSAEWPVPCDAPSLTASETTQAGNYMRREAQGLPRRLWYFR
jgi:hypothetical protein